jgi:hypothetical protein
MTAALIGVSVWIKANTRQWSVTEVLKQLHDPFVFARISLMHMRVTFDNDRMRQEIDPYVGTAKRTATVDLSVSFVLP